MAISNELKHYLSKSTNGRGKKGNEDLSTNFHIEFSLNLWKYWHHSIWQGIFSIKSTKFSYIWLPIYPIRIQVTLTEIFRSFRSHYSAHTHTHNKNENVPFLHTQLDVLLFVVLFFFLSLKQSTNKLLRINASGWNTYTQSVWKVPRQFVGVLHLFFFLSIFPLVTACETMRH